MAIGPRKIVPPKDPKQAALGPLQQDLDLLNRQRQVLGRILQEMAMGYHSVIKRVKASGDERLVVAALAHFQRMVKVYKHLANTPGLAEGETRALSEEGEVLAQASARLVTARARVASLRQKLVRDFKVLTALQAEMAQMDELKIDPDSFFKRVSRAETLRREAKARR